MVGRERAEKNVLDRAGQLPYATESKSYRSHGCEAVSTGRGTHADFGPHYALYYSSIYALKQKKKGRFARGDKERVDFVFYPIVSTENPDLQELERLQKDFGNLDKVPDVIDLPEPKKFVVLVKTRRFKKVDDIPLDFYRKE